MAARDFRTRLSRRAARAGVLLPDELVDRLTLYYELLDRWNRKINLTAITDPDEAIDRLLLEPVVAARYLPFESASVLDVGSGSGSPAIPLKLTVPGISLRMVEAKVRKSAFLREAVRQLELSDTSVETARYEELLSRPELHEAHDTVTIRAVKVESRALLTLQAFVRPGGIVMLFRGPAGPDEPAVFVAPLAYAETHPLVESTRSRVTILVKRAVGGMGVPRGTGV